MDGSVKSNNIAGELHSQLWELGTCPFGRQESWTNSHKHIHIARAFLVCWDCGTGRWNRTHRWSYPEAILGSYHRVVPGGSSMERARQQRAYRASLVSAAGWPDTLFSAVHLPRGFAPRTAQGRLFLLLEYIYTMKQHYKYFALINIRLFLFHPLLCVPPIVTTLLIPFNITHYIQASEVLHSNSNHCDLHTMPPLGCLRKMRKGQQHCTLKWC